MIGAWLRRKKRAKIVKQPFTADWRRILECNVHQYRMLEFELRNEFAKRVQILVCEKNWEGCGGLRMRDEVRVTIAGQIAMMTVGLDSVYFDHVLSVLVYPSAYKTPGNYPAPDGSVIESSQNRLGEAWWRGPVVLSWNSVLAGGKSPNSGRNLVVHEFAHQLDMLNGRLADGTPPLGSVGQTDRWNRVFESAYQDLRARHEAGRTLVIDPYATTNPGEFFAVACEMFFQCPRVLRKALPQVFAELSRFFQLDPERWKRLNAA